MLSTSKKPEDVDMMSKDDLTAVPALKNTFGTYGDDAKIKLPKKRKAVERDILDSEPAQKQKERNGRKGNIPLSYSACHANHLL